MLDKNTSPFAALSQQTNLMIMLHRQRNLRPLGTHTWTTQQSMNAYNIFKEYIEAGNFEEARQLLVGTQVSEFVYSERNFSVYKVGNWMLFLLAKQGALGVVKVAEQLYKNLKQPLVCYGPKWYTTQYNKDGISPLAAAIETAHPKLIALIYFYADKTREKPIKDADDTLLSLWSEAKRTEEEYGVFIKEFEKYRKEDEAQRNHSIFSPIFSMFSSSPEATEEKKPISSTQNTDVKQSEKTSPARVITVFSNLLCGTKKKPPADNSATTRLLADYDRGDDCKLNQGPSG